MLIDLFEEEFNPESIYSAEEVGSWLLKKGWIAFDQDKALQQFIRNAGRAFLRRIKDVDGAREWVAYKNEDGQELYAKVDATSDLKILHAQKNQLETKMKGYEKTIIKIEKRINTVTEQITIFDFLPQETQSSNQLFST